MATMTKAQVISAIKEVMRDKHAKVAYFGLIYKKENERMFCYEEVHICKNTLMTFLSEVLYDEECELEHGMRKLEDIPGDVLAKIHNRLINGISEFH